MIYRLLKEKDGIKIYARIDNDGLCRVTCSEDNPDFQAWLEEGNTPEPAETTE